MGFLWWMRPMRPRMDGQVFLRLAQHPLVKDLTTLATQRPYFASFILLQSLLCVLPISLFIIFLLGAIALASAAAVIFVLFWTGVAFIVFLPCIFIAASTGVLIWLWAFATYQVATYLYSLSPLAGPADKDSDIDAASDTAKDFPLQDARLPIDQHRNDTQPNTEHRARVQEATQEQERGGSSELIEAQESAESSEQRLEVRQLEPRALNGESSTHDTQDEDSIRGAAD